MRSLINFVRDTRRFVLRHGGVINVFWRIGQMTILEGFHALKTKITRSLTDRRALEFPQDSCKSPSSKPAMILQESHPALKPSLRPGALLLGHPFGVYGMGEHVRLSAAAFSAAGVPFGINNIYGENGFHGVHLADIHQDFPFRHKISLDGFFKANVFHINADEMVNAHLHLGKDIFTDRYNVGYWAWELSEFPDAWLPALQLVDEVWAPSRFIEQAIAKKTSSPVIRMPLAVEFPEPNGMNRAFFGLPENRFLFLFFFDFDSYIQRKNPEGAIRAFLQAFPKMDDTRVGIVIKMKGVDLHPQEFEAFQQQINLEDHRIILMDKVLTDRETKALVKVCDSFLSLHRSEGFGRGLAEAMYLGKPVIATAYSGNLDFTNEQNACLVDYKLIPVKDHEYPFATGQKWADPDLDHAVWFMRRLVNEPHYAKTLGQQAATFIKTYHSPDAVGAKYRKRLATLKML